MKTLRFAPLLLIPALFLSACAAPGTEPEAGTESARPMGMGMGNNSMMQRHHATIPEAYASLASPVPADDESIARGEAQYVLLCATCHGDGGVGDGPGGENLDPAPANIAHTSQMMSDAYLFWRISEGGAPFQTAMPAWANALDEQTRWDLINYLRALGSGRVTMRSGMGGAAPDPEQQAARQAEMLAAAVDQGLLTIEEADIFEQVHALVDARMIEKLGTGMGGPMMGQIMDEVLTDLVTEGALTRAEADTFLSVHQRLAEAGLMQ